MNTELYFSAIRASRRTLIAVNLVFLLAAVLLAIFLPPVYRSEVLLAPATDESSVISGLTGQFGGLAALAGISMPQEDHRATYIATLGSRQLASQFIADHNLLPVLFPDASADDDDKPTTWDAVRRFERKIRSVQEDRRTGLVTLAIEWKDPAQAAAWANELVRRCNGILRERAILDGKKTIAFLTQEIDKSDQVEVRKLLYQLVESETKKLAIAVTREDFAFRVVDSAMAPSKPERPKRLLIIAVGLVLGIVSSVAFLFLKMSGARPPA